MRKQSFTNKDQKNEYITIRLPDGTTLQANRSILQERHYYEETSGELSGHRGYDSEGNPIIFIGAPNSGVYIDSAGTLFGVDIG